MKKNIARIGIGAATALVGVTMLSAPAMAAEPAHADKLPPASAQASNNAYRGVEANLTNTTQKPVEVRTKWESGNDSVGWSDWKTLQPKDSLLTSAHDLGLFYTGTDPEVNVQVRFQGETDIQNINCYNLTSGAVYANINPGTVQDGWMNNFNNDDWAAGTSRGHTFQFHMNKYDNTYHFQINIQQ